MRKFFLISAILFFILQNVSAQLYTPSDYFPLAYGNNWMYETVFDTTNPNNDRMSYIEVVDTTIFGIPGETISYKVEYSEWFIGQDTSVYRTAYYSFNSNGDLGYTAQFFDSLTVYDSLIVILKNPIVVGDSIYLDGDVYDVSYTVVSITDTLNLLLGYFENCLHIHEKSWLNGQPLEENDIFYIPISYLPTGAGMGKNEGIYWYQYPDSFRYGYSHLVECNADPTPPVHIANNSSSNPINFTLKQNHPNPFNPNTTISYTLHKSSDVGLTIYNILGQTIRTLVSNKQTTGTYRIIWDGRNDLGENVSSGIYLYSLKANGHTTTKKMVLLQ